MLIATLVLSAALVPQAPLPEEETPFDAEPAPTRESLTTPEMEDVDPLAAESPPPLEADAPPAMETMPEAAPMPGAPEAMVQDHIDAGLRAFIRGRFSSAREEFQKAYDADPRSAAAAFYLGYAHYKLGEPTRRMDADKERAKELFAKAYDLDPAFQPVWGARRSE